VRATSDLPKPIRYGYVLDLPRLAGNHEFVIPGHPEQSELWELVRRGEMPPPDSPHGPLSSAEKEVVRAWIAAGAPDVRATPTNSERALPAPEPTTPVSRSPTDRMIRFLGRFHLLLLHFPIALLIAAGIAEVLAWRTSRVPSSIVLFCVTLAALAVVPTVGFGWLHAEAGNGVGMRLSLHRWVGMATGAWVLVTAVLMWRDEVRGTRSWLARVALGLAVVLVSATAHFGGMLAHGREFFDL
jgi:hypothetical protein